MSCPIIPGEMDDFNEGEIIHTMTPQANILSQLDEIAHPIEDYELPILMCQQCRRESNVINLAYVNNHGIYYRLGYLYQLNDPTKYQNSHLCYYCLDHIQSTRLD